jgi:hypothetical protein
MQSFSWGGTRGYIKIPLPAEYNKVRLIYGAFNGGVRLYHNSILVDEGGNGRLYEATYSKGDYLLMDESNMMDIKAVWVRYEET